MSLEKKTVLIVEDEPDTAEMFAEMMRLSGFRVLKAYGGENALAILDQETPDAIVLDMMMPEMSGLDVLDRLRQRPELSKLPVVIVSAKSLPVDVKTGLQAGATFYLTKPVSFIDLRKAVERALSIAASGD